MRRPLTVTLIAAIAALLAGCGKSDDTGTKISALEARLDRIEKRLGDGEGPRASSRGGGGAIGIGAARGTDDPALRFRRAERAITRQADDAGRGCHARGRPRWPGEPREACRSRGARCRTPGQDRQDQGAARRRASSRASSGGARSASVVPRASSHDPERGRDRRGRSGRSGQVAAARAGRQAATEPLGHDASFSFNRTRSGNARIVVGT